MNIFKKLAGICMAISLCLGVCAFTACGNNNDGGFQAKENAYNFRVVNADGTAATGYQVQLCTADQTTCYPGVAVDGEGYCAYTCPEGVYEIHLLPADTEFTSNPELTPATYSTEIIVITLAA